MQNVYTIFIPATPSQYRTKVSLISLRLIINKKAPLLCYLQSTSTIVVVHPAIVHSSIGSLSIAVLFSLKVDIINLLFIII